MRKTAEWFDLSFALSLCPTETHVGPRGKQQQQGHYLLTLYGHRDKHNRAAAELTMTTGDTWRHTETHGGSVIPNSHLCLFCCRFRNIP